MAQDIDSPHVMGCPVSLWPTGYHSCQGHMKSPSPTPAPPKTGRYTTYEGARHFCPISSAVPAPSTLAQRFRSLPIAPYKDLWLVLPRGFPGFPKSQATSVGFSDTFRPCAQGLRQAAGVVSVQCSSGKAHPATGEGEATQAGTPRTWPPTLSPHCSQVSICPHLRRSSVSRTPGCSCACLAASSLVGFSPLVWASLSSSWSPEPPASLSPLLAFLRYSLGGDSSPVLEGRPLRLSQLLHPRALQRRDGSAQLGCCALCCHPHSFRHRGPPRRGCTSLLHRWGNRHEELLVPKDMQLGGSRAGIQSQV